MRARPYLIENVTRGKERRLRALDPNKQEFSEAVLQEILAEHPDLLPTGETEAVFAPLATIGKEVVVSSGRIDVLYMSSSGYPVIVETKLWKNPESKREVVAQVPPVSAQLPPAGVYLRGSLGKGTRRPEWPRSSFSAKGGDMQFSEILKHRMIERVNGTGGVKAVCLQVSGLFFEVLDEVRAFDL